VESNKSEGTLFLGTLRISSQDILLIIMAIYYVVVFGFLKRSAAPDDRAMGLLICVAAADSVIDWIQQITLRRYAKTAFLPRLLHALRHVCKSVMFVAIMALVVIGGIWVFHHTFS
jgi:hypothetical protein